MFIYRKIVGSGSISSRKSREKALKSIKLDTVSNPDKQLVDEFTDIAKNSVSEVRSSTPKKNKDPNVVATQGTNSQTGRKKEDDVSLARFNLLKRSKSRQKSVKHVKATQIKIQNGEPEKIRYVNGSDIIGYLDNNGAPGQRVGGYNENQVAVCGHCGMPNDRKYAGVSYKQCCCAENKRTHRMTGNATPLVQYNSDSEDEMDTDQETTSSSDNAAFSLSSTEGFSCSLNEISSIECETSSAYSTTASVSSCASWWSRPSASSLSYMSLQLDRFAPTSDAYIDEGGVFISDDPVAMETGDILMTSPIDDDINLSTSSGLPDDVTDCSSESCHSVSGKENHTRVVSLAETGYASSDSLDIRQSFENIWQEKQIISKQCEKNSHSREIICRANSENKVNNMRSSDSINISDVESGDRYFPNAGEFTNSDLPIAVPVASGLYENHTNSENYGSLNRRGKVTVKSRPTSEYFTEYADVTTSHARETIDKYDTIPRVRNSNVSVFSEFPLVPRNDDSLKRRSRYGARASTCTIERSSIYSNLGSETSVDEYTKVEFRNDTYNRQPDLRVRIEDTVFRLHSDLMKRKSGYFRGVLSSAWAESFHIRQGQAVEFLSSPPTTDSFKTLMNFLYFDSMDVAKNAVEDLLAASDFLQITLPANTLDKYLNIQSWEKYQQLCKKYNCGNVQQSVHHYLADHYRHIGNTFKYLVEDKQTKANVSGKYETAGRFTVPALSMVYLSKVHEHVECEHALCCYDERSQRWYEMERFPRVLPVCTNRRWFTHAHNMYVSLQDTDNIYQDGSALMLEYNSKTGKWNGNIPRISTTNTINGVTATAGPDDTLYVLESGSLVKAGPAKPSPGLLPAATANNIMLHVFQKGSKLRPRWDRFSIPLNTREHEGPGQIFFFDVCCCGGRVFFLYSKARCPCLYLASITQKQTPHGVLWVAEEETVVGGPYMQHGQSLRRLVSNGRDLYIVITSTRCVLVKQYDYQRRILDELSRFDNDHKLFKHVRYDRKRATAVTIVTNKIYIYNFPRSKLICCYNLDAKKWSYVRMPPRVLSDPYDTIELMSLQIPRDFPKVARPILT
ncbi:uncharacterized protein LOC144357883 [Saccoglossus kowalevskii]